MFSHLIFAILLIVIYVTPTLIAFYRGHASKWAIFVVNFTLGWTVIAWFICFVWAVGNKGATNTISIINNAR